MNILILGGDGYLGWPTAMHLSAQGHSVAVVDNYFRRKACDELQSPPLLPVPDLGERTRLWQAASNHTVHCAEGDLCVWEFMQDCFTGKAFGLDWTPDAVVHYAEQPSAPYSMMDRDKAAFTLSNNLMSTMNLVQAVKEFNPACHIVKLGTMGVYGTPDIDIEEGYLDVDYKGRSHRFLYPKTPGSLYHLTKAQDGDMLYFYCRIWDIRVTDLNQGPVYGIFTDQSDDEQLATIFNYDDVFGTVVNRFLVQAVAGIPLTVYGKGGQTRGYLDLRDTLACVELAILNPAQAGEYKVYNQITETFTVNELAELILEGGKQAGIDVTVKNIENPRREAEEHYYNPTYTGLKDLGLEPHLLTSDKVARMLEFVARHKGRIREDAIMPKVKWT
ncbi:NAD-dependent epimerase/dehydratase family protein [Desulfovibrio ferrophilus]|uniref:NAD-dependent epimerase/dehydratase n=1 Tax=Desulfovibrio ferrophilus TaxID=241368 RepID=A0A2Z6B222_9BACT|nr:NAD-dependent epimerase/dehydratase family protein [Desulfovibrio ferrophilus]BBD09567.1 NAD-dependent epimerase/dehydratase [Desulfovibrio ferrophilus]